MFPIMCNLQDVSVYYVQSRKKPTSIATYPMLIVAGTKRLYWNLFIEGVFFSRAIPSPVKEKWLPAEYMHFSAVVLRGHPNRMGKYIHHIKRRGGDINAQSYLPRFMRRRGRRSENDVHNN